MKIDLHAIVSGTTRELAPNVEALRSKLAERHDVALTIHASHEPEDLTPEALRAAVALEKINSALYDSQLRSLSARQVSNALKHADALRDIGAATRVGAIALVVEDDCELCPDFSDAFDRMLNAVPASSEFVVLGLPGTRHGLQPLAESYRALPVVNAYIVQPALAARLAAAFRPVRYVTNIHISYLLEAFSVAPALYAPALILDGSKTGACVSTIAQGAGLVFCPAYTRARELIEGGDHETAMSVLESADVRDHPDMLHLRALCALHLHGRLAAQPIFQRAVDAFESSGLVLDSSSRLLGDFINSHRPDEGLTKRNAPRASNASTDTTKK